MAMSLCGVEAGREAEVFTELETSIDDINKLRRWARNERERSSAATGAAGVVAEDRLGKVRDGFRTARASRP
jgi:hypothetical protein